MNLVTTDQLTGRISTSIQDQLISGDALRAEALEVFQRLGIPHPKNEEYKHTPIGRYLDKNFQFTSVVNGTSLKNIDPFLIPDLDANHVVFINGVYKEEFSSFDTNEVQITLLEKALASNDKTATEYFGKYADYKKDSLTAWNTAAWNHGIFINVSEKAVVEKPIIIQHIVDGTVGEQVLNNRNLVVVGKNAQVTLIEKFDSTGSANHFSNLVNEFVVNENAGMEYYTIQNDSNNRYQHASTQVYQKKSSRVNTYTFTLQGKLYRNNLSLVLDGEGIESHMYGLYLLGQDTLADNHTVVDHMKANSFSNELYKGIMDSSSKGVFNGKIYVRPNAQKTNAFQANRNILLTDKSVVNTKPQLEIWADDVKCSHGCTTGQLDEEALFYLQSRGIDKESARAMMLYAFAGDVIEHVPHPVLRKYLDTMISDRLHKNF
jgi:Fe-S cluster assembly protein SufD